MKRALVYLSLIPVLVALLGWLVWSSRIPHSEAAANDCVYTVQRGDTLSQIARRYNTTVDAIVAANRIANPNLIHVGNRFVIPNCTAGQPAAPAPAQSPGAAAPAPSQQAQTPVATAAPEYSVAVVKSLPPTPPDLPLALERQADAATVQLLVATRLAVHFGTGTVVGADGRTILTAFHVVGDSVSDTPYPAVEILVGPYKGYTLRASLIAWDVDNDLAVLRVEERSDFQGFAFLPMADSDAAQLGEPVYLLSYPSRREGGLARTRGSLLATVSDQKGVRRGFITEATASPGSSGGVALNGRGEVLGIITRGFFLPGDIAQTDRQLLSRLTGFVPIQVARPLLAKAGQ